MKAWGDIDISRYTYYHVIVMDVRSVEPAEEIAPCCGMPDETRAHGIEVPVASVIFKALSDETRLQIMVALSRMSELCECLIVPAFGLSQPTISYHLKVLREAGLIESDRRGQWIYHRVNTGTVMEAIRTLTRIA